MRLTRSASASVRSRSRATSISRGGDVVFGPINHSGIDTDVGTAVAGGFEDGKSVYITINPKIPARVSGARAQVHSSKSVIITSEAGKQGNYTCYAIGTRSQWVTASGIDCTSVQDPYSYFNYDPLRGQSLPDTVNPAFVTPTGVPYATKYCLRTADVFGFFVNLYNVQVHIKLTYFVSKGRTTLQPYDAWNTGLISRGGSNNQAAVVTTTAGSTTAGNVGGYMTPETIGAEYKPNEVLSRNWKIAHIEHITIPPGGNHETVAHIKINKVHSYESLLQNTEEYPKDCVFVQATIRGQPGLDVTTGTIPTFLSTNVGCIFNQKLSFQVYNDRAHNQDIDIGTSNVPRGATGANQKVWSVGVTGTQVG